MIQDSVLPTALYLTEVLVISTVIVSSLQVILLLFPRVHYKSISKREWPQAVSLPAQNNNEVIITSAAKMY